MRMQDVDAGAERWAVRRTEIFNELLPELRGVHADMCDEEFLAMIERLTEAKVLYERFGQDP
jgi:hypothetical protein